MINITCNLVTYNMPIDYLVKTIDSLIDTTPDKTQINLINNGTEIDTKKIDMSKEDKQFLEKELEDSGSLQHLESIPVKQYDLFIYDHGPDNCHLPKTWNLCKDISPTDWLMISNDDIFFKDGWYDRFCEKVMDGCLLIGCGFSCFLIHKKVFELIGMFDERLTHAYCEDTDFLLRIINSGGIRISQEFRKYNFDCALFGYFNHYKRDDPESYKKIIQYWKENNIKRPIPQDRAKHNYRIFEEIWGFNDKSVEVDKILQSYNFDWSYK